MLHLHVNGKICIKDYLYFVEVRAVSNIQDLVDGLMNCDDKQAYHCLKQLEDKSSRSAEVYPFFDTFVEMLNNTNSYIRTRGIVLIALTQGGMLIIRLTK